MNQANTEIDPRPPLKVVTVYDALDSGAQAMQLYRNLSDKFSREVELIIDLGQMERLGDAPMGDRLAKAAVEADVILIALLSGKEVSGVLRTWIEKWIEKKRGHESAMVFLCGKQGHLQISSPAHTYLREQASRVGMTFIPST